MSNISQVNKKLTTTKILAINNKILARTGSLTQPAFFKNQLLATSFAQNVKNEFDIYKYVRLTMPPLVSSLLVMTAGGLYFIYSVNIVEFYSILNFFNLGMVPS